ncbi:MAG: hypothetical protein ACI867_000547 [Glaciecola sp.]
MSRTDQGGFFRDGPVLADQWATDAALQGMLRRMLPANVLPLDALRALQREATRHDTAAAAVARTFAADGLDLLQPLGAFAPDDEQLARGGQP